MPAKNRWLTGCIVQDNDVELVSRWLARCRDRKVVIFGDLAVERALVGRMTGVAPEGPVPEVLVERSEYELAAAGYAASLAAAFGAKTTLVTALGADEMGNTALALLRDAGVDTQAVLVDARLTTSSNTRVIATAQHKPPQELLRLRMDRDRFGIPPDLVPQLLARLREAVRDAGALLVVEQGGGLMSAELLSNLRTEAQIARTAIVGDLQTLASHARRFDALVLNDEELARCAQGDRANQTEIKDSAKKLLEDTGTGWLLVTRGPQPAMLVHRGEVRALPVEAAPVYDVRGAGEAVSTALALALGSGLEPTDAARLALLVGSLSVTRPGRAVIRAEEFRRHVLGKAGALQARKVVSVDELRRIVAEARGRGERIVWTNGCFDLLHVGHILYLEKAKSLGDILVVGLNSDASVRATKGPNRPIVNEAQRARLLASLECTDYVVIFDAPSPKEIIAELKPDVYVKGGDYTIDTINQEERRIVEGYGGEIALLPGVEGMSTTELIRRVLRAYGGEHDRQGD